MATLLARGPRALFAGRMAASKTPQQRSPARGPGPVWIEVVSTARKYRNRS